MNDISPDFKPSRYDSNVIQEIIKHEGTPQAIRSFSNNHRGLSNYAYWFLLGTLWVSYTGFSNLELWKRLFYSRRPGRATSLMKPSELEAFNAMPETICVYRAPREGEKDWIAYTTRMEKAIEFARQREATRITVYLVDKKDVLAYFSRRGEHEILVLDRHNAVKQWNIPVYYVT